MWYFFFELPFLLYYRENALQQESERLEVVRKARVEELPVYNYKLEVVESTISRFE